MPFSKKHGGWGVPVRTIKKQMNGKETAAAGKHFLCHLQQKKRSSNMKRKVVSVVLALTMVAGMAVGCGSSKPAETTTTDDAAAEGTTTDGFVVRSIRKINRKKR